MATAAARLFPQWLLGSRVIPLTSFSRVPRLLIATLWPRGGALRLLALPLVGALGAATSAQPSGSPLPSSERPRSVKPTAGDVVDDEEDTLIDRVLIHLPEIGFGTLLGFASGYALKQFGKVSTDARALDGNDPAVPVNVTVRRCSR